MAEVLTQFSDVMRTTEGVTYRARVCGTEMTDGRWETWIEFIPNDGGEPLRTARESTQPNRADAAYWASGLTAIYLEGALVRALSPFVHRKPAASEPAFDAPAPVTNAVVTAPTSEAVLDPFSVYEKGEALLRKELAALSGWHLVNIIDAYELSDLSTSALNQMSVAGLIDCIVQGVKARLPARR